LEEKKKSAKAVSKEVHAVKPKAPEVIATVEVDDSDSSDSTSEEDETLQVLMSMTSGMLKNARKGRPIYA
jgi:hypothetical protein